MYLRLREFYLSGSGGSGGALGFGDAIYIYLGVQWRFALMMVLLDRLVFYNIFLGILFVGFPLVFEGHLQGCHLWWLTIEK